MPQQLDPAKLEQFFLQNPNASIDDALKMLQPQPETRPYSLYGGLKDARITAAPEKGISQKIADFSMKYLGGYDEENPPATGTDKFMALVRGGLGLGVGIPSLVESIQGTKPLQGFLRSLPQRGPADVYPGPTEPPWPSSPWTNKNEQSRAINEILSGYQYEAANRVPPSRYLTAGNPREHVAPFRTVLPNRNQIEARLADAEGGLTGSLPPSPPDSRQFTRVFDRPSGMLPTPEVMPEDQIRRVIVDRVRAGKLSPDEAQVALELAKNPETAQIVLARIKGGSRLTSDPGVPPNPLEILSGGLRFGSGEPNQLNLIDRFLSR